MEIPRQAFGYFFVVNKQTANLRLDSAYRVRGGSSPIYIALRLRPTCAANSPYRAFRASDPIEVSVVAAMRSCSSLLPTR